MEHICSKIKNVLLQDNKTWLNGQDNLAERSCVCVCFSVVSVFSIALTLVTIEQTSLVKTMTASSIAQYLFVNL